MVSGPDLDRGLAGRGPHLPAQRDPHAGQQFRHAEWLDDIVVGAQFEQLHLVGLARAHRQHDDRHVRPGADALHDFGAVHFRQAEIDNDEVDRLQAGGADRLGAASGFYD